MLKKLLLIYFFFIAHSAAEEALVYGSLYSHHSEVFKQERRYMVSLPEAYLSENYRYPVFYVIDADFQFHHVANTVRHLARMGKIPPMIVIGVANQGPQDYLSSNTWPSAEAKEFGGVEAFYRYLSTELLPQINQHYRTNGKNALAGYSLGGLAVLHHFAQNRSPFSAFFAMSPSVWYDDYSFNHRLQDFLNEQAGQSANAEKQQRHLFLSLANEQGMGVNELVAVLDKYSGKDIMWQFRHYPEETHYSTALPALYDGLKFLFPEYFMDIGEMMTEANYQAVLDKFVAKKSLWSGFRFEWLQSYTLAKYFFASNQQDNIDQALVIIQREFPESYHELAINFALGFNKKEAFAKSRALLEKIAISNQENVKWHHQMSIALHGLKQTEKAIAHHATALSLAKSQRLESWSYWELEPDKITAPAH